MGVNIGLAIWGWVVGAADAMAICKGLVLRVTWMRACFLWISFIQKLSPSPKINCASNSSAVLPI